MDEDTKTITIGFRIPVGVDMTSEQSAAYKAVIVEALGAYHSDYEGTSGYDPTTAELVSDLLTES